MSSHESVQKNGAQPRTSLAGAPQVFGGHGPQAAAISAAGNGGPHLASPAAPTAGIVQPAPMRLQPGFDVQLIAQLAQAASSSAFSAAGPPNAPGASDPQNSPQTPRVTPPVAVSNPSTAFSPFSGTSNSPASSSGTNMTTQQMISQYQVLLAMMQQQQQPQPRIPAFPTPQLDLRQMLILQQSQQMQQQQQQLQQLAALQQQHHHHQQQQQQQQQHLQQQQAAAAAAALAAQQKPVQRHPVSSSIALQQQQQRNLADSTAMPPPPVPRRPMPTSVSLPPPQPSTSQPRTTPPHPQPLPSTSYQQPAPQPAPPRPQPVVNYRQRLQSIPEMGTMNAKPYYPTHFMRGTRIQLESGEQKNVEDLTAKDFHMSGAAAEGIDVELSRIEAIEKASEGNVQTAKVTLSAGEIKAKVTIQVYVEHPFFIIGVGWASINPTLAKARFGLDCKNLAVGHECISLVKAEDKRQYVMNHNGDEKGQRRASLPTNLSPNGNGSTHKASTSSDGSPALIRSDLRARIKTYQRTRSPSLSSVSQKSTVIRRPRRHRSEPPADLFEIKKRSFSRKRRTRGRAASETCLMDLIGPF